MNSTSESHPGRVPINMAKIPEELFVLKNKPHNMSVKN